MCIIPGMTLHRNSALQAGVGQIFDRVLAELSMKIRALQVDQAEYVALKAIVLLNPGMYKNMHSTTQNCYSFSWIRLHAYEK